MINISINSKKMFDWDGDADAVARIDQEMARLAAKGNTTPQALAHSMLRVLFDQGRFIPTADQEFQMMMLTWLVLTMPTHHPDHPGRFCDYIAVWNFDFDVCDDPKTPDGFVVEVRAGVNKRGIA